MKLYLKALFVFLFIFEYGLTKSKVDLLFGFFSLEATTKEKKGNVSNIGSYQLNYRYAFASNTELSIGYSLIASKTFTGDFGFGPDIGFAYFPFSTANVIEAQSESTSYKSYEIYKPYLSASFHQRQYQSIQSSYAGFGFGFGLEIYWKSNTSIKVEFRYLPLGGPDNAISNEMDIFSGLTFHL